MEDVQKIINNLQTIGTKLGIEGVTDAVLSQFVDMANGRLDRATMVIISKQLVSILNGVMEILSGNLCLCVTGVMQIVKATSILFPIVFPLIKDFAKFIYSVLGFTGGIQHQDTTGSALVCAGSATVNTGGGHGSLMGMIEKIISDVFHTHDDHVLKAETDGVCRLLTFAHNMVISISSKMETHPTECDITCLVSSITIGSVVQVLGQVESRMLALMADAPASASESALSKFNGRLIQYVDMYCHLAILRDAVIWELYSLLIYSGHATSFAEGLMAGLKGEQERDTSLVQILLAPNLHQVQLASFFDPDRWPLTYNFMSDRKAFGAPIRHGTPATMCTIKWPGWFVTHEGVTSSYIGASRGCPLWKTHNFIFMGKKDDTDTCYYISPQNKKGTFLVMTAEPSRWVKLTTCENPGREGEWNVLNVKDNDSVFVLSTRRWPAHFLCMSFSGWLQGRVISVTDQSAHWHITYNGRNASRPRYTTPKVTEASQLQ